MTRHTAMDGSNVNTESWPLGKSPVGAFIHCRSCYLRIDLFFGQYNPALVERCVRSRLYIM